MIRFALACFCGVAFTLKIAHVVDWSWWVILIPALLLALGALFMLGMRLTVQAATRNFTEQGLSL